MKHGCIAAGDRLWQVAEGLTGGEERSGKGPRRSLPERRVCLCH